MKKVYISTLVLTSFWLASCGGSGNQNTSTPAPTVNEVPAEPAVAQIEVPAEINDLLNKHTCLTCHAANKRIIGPAYTEVAKLNYTPDQIVDLVHKPKPEHWPDYPPMAALPNVPKEDIIKIANWINSLK